VVATSIGIIIKEILGLLMIAGYINIIYAIDVSEYIIKIAADHIK